MLKCSEAFTYFLLLAINSYSLKNQQTAEVVNLQQELTNYGISKPCCRMLSSPSPDLVGYLDLLEPRDDDFLCPDAVAESQGYPLLFIVNESRLLSQDSLPKLHRALASRGDRAYLAKVRPGVLEVIPVSLEDKHKEWKLYKADSPDALTFFSRLARRKLSDQSEHSGDEVFSEMYDLLKTGIDRIAHRIGREDTLSLVGRALFFRFLCDRSIVKDNDVQNICPGANSLKECFDSPIKAYRTSRWLDETFNGDFLPLSRTSLKFFTELGVRSKVVYHNLQAIVRGLRPVGGDNYQHRFSWDMFDFAHVPVGLLSQVYEAFCRKWDTTNAKSTSVHYTPRNIASTLVDEAFDGLTVNERTKVLDPACGAGIFLVLAFRLLYKQRWIANGTRPDTKDIREILTNQITGFDINESALRLTALSLYLTAIELDPNPLPPQKLRFGGLRGVVLFDQRQDSDPIDGPVIGSLGNHVDPKLNQKFDVILCNPPWTRLSKECRFLANEYTSVSKDVICRRGEAQLSKQYENPNSAPDLAFLWRSTEWCIDGGRIAFALPARILLKQEEVPEFARKAIFRLVEVTGIINGSNLSDTEVWPDMDQPFMLLFAINRKPRKGHLISFVSPQWEDGLDSINGLRIDSKSTQLVDNEAALEEGWIWKALAIGHSLDVGVVRQIKSSSDLTFSNYWEKELKLVSSTGYMIKEEQDQHSATFLMGLPNLTSSSNLGFIVNPRRLDAFSRETLARPRKEKVYKGPLVLLKESPGADRANGWALLSLVKVAYSQSFYGYSASGHNEAELLVRYVHLFVHSLVWMHYALLTSPKLGAERRTLYKSGLDDCPFIPVENLTTRQKNQVFVLSQRLLSHDEEVFDEIDLFFSELFELDALSTEVIKETLEVCMPYREAREKACKKPSMSERKSFANRLELILSPFFSELGIQIQVELESLSENDGDNCPFSALLLSKKGIRIPSGKLFREVLLKLADDTGATMVIQSVENGLIIGLLNQFRYWTLTRARLLASEIVSRHLGQFEEEYQ